MPRKITLRSLISFDKGDVVCPPTPPPKCYRGFLPLQKLQRLIIPFKDKIHLFLKSKTRMQSRPLRGKVAMLRRPLLLLLLHDTAWVKCAWQKSGSAAVYHTTPPHTHTSLPRSPTVLREQQLLSLDLASPRAAVWWLEVWGGVSRGSSLALSQGDEQQRPISYAGLGPWVWVEVGWVHPVSWLH